MQLGDICGINRPMRGTCLRQCLTVFIAAVAMLGVGAAHATDVEALRIWTGKTHTRAVIDLSGPLQYKLFQLHHPGRIVLDLDRSALVSTFVAPQGSGVLKRVRTGRHGKHGVRVVFDLASKVRPKSFLLKPNGEDGYRLVVDMYPDKPVVVAAKPVAAHEQKLPQQRKVVVAIDAGHGGVDPGAHGPHGTQEKTITLKVAKDLARLVDAQPGMTAVLTRSTDKFIPLKRRYQIAREHNADLFISIHADAFRNSDARGSSVWVLSPRGKTSEAARWLADEQNRADLIGVSLDDKDDTLAAVLLDLQQGYAMKASDIVAKNVLAGLAKLGPTHRGYVEKANFVVLRSPDVPSILVETAFITNPHEERKLRNPAHREKLAEAILDGVRNYFIKTPPPGTLFAAEVAKRNGETLASEVKTAPGLAKAAATPENGPSASTAIDDGVQNVHRVSSGETLSGIASQYGVSVHALKDANSMTSDIVRTGTVLAIPTS